MQYSDTWSKPFPVLYWCWRCTVSMHAVFTLCFCPSRSELTKLLITKPNCPGKKKIRKWIIRFDFTIIYLQKDSEVLELQLQCRSGFPPKHKAAPETDVLFKKKKKKKHKDQWKEKRMYFYFSASCALSLSLTNVARLGKLPGTLSPVLRPVPGPVSVPQRKEVGCVQDTTGEAKKNGWISLAKYWSAGRPDEAAKSPKVKALSEQTQSMILHSMKQRTDVTCLCTCRCKTIRKLLNSEGSRVS